MDQPAFRHPLLGWHVRLLLLFAVGCLWMCHASLKPNRSYWMYRVDLGMFLPFYLILLQRTLGSGRLRRGLYRAGLRCLWLLLLLGSVIGLVYAAAPEHVRNQIEPMRVDYSHLIKREPLENKAYVWRLQFPFGHHNRLAFVCMLAALVFAAVAWRARRTPARLWAGVGAASACLNLLLTLNRTCTLGLALGAFCYLVLTRGRRTLWLLVLTPLIYFALPVAQQARLRTILSPQTYTNPTSTVVHRFEHWQSALYMIDENPVFGIGYSWRHFQQYYEQVVRFRIESDTDEAVHAHNLWLQVGAEVGLPLLAVYFVWHLTRWLMLLPGLRVRRLRGSPHTEIFILLVSLEVMIQLFCLVNLPARRPLGFITYGLWALLLVEGLRLYGARPGRPPALSGPAASQ